MVSTLATIASIPVNDARTPASATHLNAMSAHNQWASRPADERFSSLPALRDYIQGRENLMKFRDVKPGILAIDYDADKRAPVLVHTETGYRMGMTNWSAGQLCRLSDTPQGFLSTLKPETAATVLKERWDATRYERTDDVRLHLSVNGSATIRALTSTRFDRLPDLRLVDQLDRMSQSGWRLAPARPHNGNDASAKPLTAEDIGPWTRMTVGEMAIPSGIYAGDRDMFAFMIDADHPIADPSDSSHALYRGCMIENSEVGNAALTVATLLFDSVCGNHIVWGCTEFKEIRGVHLGNGARNAHNRFHVSASGFGDPRVISDFISKARNLELASNKLELIELLFSRRILGRLEAAKVYTIAEEYRDVHGSPLSAWGIASAITRKSQTGDGAQYAGNRRDADKPAEKVLALVG